MMTKFLLFSINDQGKEVLESECASYSEAAAEAQGYYCKVRIYARVFVNEFAERMDQHLEDLQSMNFDDRNVKDFIQESIHARPVQIKKHLGMAIEKIEASLLRLSEGNVIERVPGIVARTYRLRKKVA